MSIASSSRLVTRSVITISRRQITRLAVPSSRSYASEAAFDPSKVERATDEVDVCIVGGGPAGLSAAIRLKQLEKERGGDELRVVVLEKGSEVGESLNTCRNSVWRSLADNRITHSVWSCH